MQRHFYFVYQHTFLANINTRSLFQFHFITNIYERKTNKNHSYQILVRMLLCFVSILFPSLHSSIHNEFSPLDIIKITTEQKKFRNKIWMKWKKKQNQPYTARIRHSNEPTRKLVICGRGRKDFDYTLLWPIISSKNNIEIIIIHMALSHSIAIRIISNRGTKQEYNY